MITRTEYLEQLIQWKNEQVIKVITGIRRCGKSTLLQQFQNYLIETGTQPSQIITINFEDLEYEELQDYKKLYAYIKNRLVADKITYILLDEIQKVSSFEKVVDSLYIKDNVDIYLTGSNAYMLSSDLATLLTGRYVEIKMLPLSLKEFLTLTKQNPTIGLPDYISTGGMPYLATMSRSTEKIDMYLEGIYNTVIVKDIEDRQLRKVTSSDQRKINDITLLKTIAKFLASVIGSPISIRSVTDYLTSTGRKVSANTVSDYVAALVESFIFYPVEPFDIVGKNILKANKKFYMVDLGLRNHILPRKKYDFGFSIENIVYFELIRRGFRVFIGRQGNTEVDFVAEKQGQYQYYQVTADMTAEDTFNREMRPLQLIKDNYEKYILTMDHNTPGNYNGVKVVYLLDWLLK